MGLDVAAFADEFYSGDFGFVEGFCGEAALGFAVAEEHLAGGCRTKEDALGGGVGAVGEKEAGLWMRPFWWCSSEMQVMNSPWPDHGRSCAL